MRKRCTWVLDNPLCQSYHDTEWGVPVHEDRAHFEYIVLDGMQAGLSWMTVLNKRENFRKAFDNFDVNRIALYNSRKVDSLLQDEGIIRNRLKIQAAIKNAKVFLEVQKEFGSFDNYIWSFVGGRPKKIAWTSDGEIPVRTPESDAMSAELKKRGFTFVGSTICYAYMQAAGLVNDHTMNCFRYNEVS